MQLVGVFPQNGFCLAVCRFNDGANLIVNLSGHTVGIIPGGAQIPSQKDLALVVAVNHRSQLLAEAIACHHAACCRSRTLQVVGSTGGDIVQNQLLCHTSAQQRDDVFLHLSFADEALILFRQGHGIAACHTAGDDGNLMHLILMVTVVGTNGVAGFVVCRQALLLRCHLVGLLFRSGDHLDGRLLNLLHGDCPFILPCCQQTRLVDQIFQICAGEADGRLGDGGKIHIRPDVLALGVHLQDGFPSLDIRIAHHDLPVEPSRTHQRRVENIPTVGGCDDNDVILAGEAVHLYQQLVQGLFPFIMSATDAGAAVAAYGVNLIDEDNGGRIFLCLFEQVTDT